MPGRDVATNHSTLSPSPLSFSGVRNLGLWSPSVGAHTQVPELCSRGWWACGQSSRSGGKQALDGYTSRKSLFRALLSSPSHSVRIGSSCHSRMLQTSTIASVSIGMGAPEIVFRSQICKFGGMRRGATGGPRRACAGPHRSKNWDDFGRYGSVRV